MQRKLPLNLGARYRVVSEIASGGMGVVYLSVRLEPDGTRRPVAVKALHAHLADDPEMIASFVDEARIASRIVHPNVVRVEDVEMVGEQLVIVMEYVEGVALAMLLKNVRARDAVLPIPVVRRIVHDALVGLHAAHELRDDAGAPLGVVHRDVSPHNLLVGADGLTRVSDFGIATATGRVASTRTGGGVKGKLQYLSPEQVYRKPLDRRADVFAVGTVLWECLTGRRLFSAGTEGETLAMVLREPIAPPSGHRAEVPIELDEICLRALERDPERRFQSARDAADALAEGEMASREEVGTLVAQAAPSSLSARREVLSHALRSAGFSAPSAVETEAADTVDPRASVAHEARPASSRLPLVAALFVGVVGGAVGVGFAARANKAPATDAVTARSGASEPAVLPPPPAPSSAPAPTAPQVAPRATSSTPAAHPRHGTSARPPKKPTPGGRPFMPEDL